MTARVAKGDMIVRELCNNSQRSKMSAPGRQSSYVTWSGPSKQTNLMLGWPAPRNIATLVGVSLERRSRWIMEDGI